MAKIPRIVSPTVQQGAAPRPRMSGAESVGTGLMGVGKGLGDAAAMLEGIHQRAQERELQDAQTGFEAEVDGHEHGGEMASVQPNAQGSVEYTLPTEGWRSKVGANFEKGSVDDRILPDFDKAAQSYADGIKNHDTREAFLDWAAKARNRYEVRARMFEDEQGREAMKGTLNARRKKHLHRITQLSALIDFGLQREDIVSYEEDAARGYAAMGMTEDEIEVAFMQDRAAVAAASIAALIDDEQPKQARRYMTDYGHELTSRDRGMLTARLEDKEEYTEAAVAVLDAFETLELPGGQPSDQDQKKLRQIRTKLLRQGKSREFIAYFDAEVQHAKSQHAAEREARLEQGRVSIFDQVFESGSVDNVQGLSEHDSDFRIAMRKLAASVTESRTRTVEPPYDQSAAALQDALARLEDGEDWASVAADTVLGMNKPHASIFHDAMKAVIKGEKPKDVFSNIQQVAIAEYRRSTGETGDNDATIRSDNAAMFLDLMAENDATDGGMDFKDVRSWVRRRVLKAKLDREGFGKRDRTRFETVDQIPADELVDIIDNTTDDHVRIKDAFMKSLFPNWTAVGASDAESKNLARFGDSDPLNWTVKEFIKGKRSSEKLPKVPLDESDVHSALLLAIQGEPGYEDLFDILQKHADAGTVPEENTLEGGGLDDLRREIATGRTRAHDEVLDMARSLISTTVKSVKIGDLPHELSESDMRLGEDTYGVSTEGANGEFIKSYLRLAHNIGLRRRELMRVHGVTEPRQVPLAAVFESLGLDAEDAHYWKSSAADVTAAFASMSPSLMHARWLSAQSADINARKKDRFHKKRFEGN